MIFPENDDLYVIVYYFVFAELFAMQVLIDVAEQKPIKRQKEMMPDEPVLLSFGLAEFIVVKVKNQKAITYYESLLAELK